MYQYYVGQGDQDTPQVPFYPQSPSNLFNFHDSDVWPPNGHINGPSGECHMYSFMPIAGGVELVADTWSTSQSSDTVSPPLPPDF